MQPVTTPGGGSGGARAAGRGRLAWVIVALGVSMAGAGGGAAQGPAGRPLHAPGAGPPERPLPPLAVTRLDDHRRAEDLDGRVFSLRFAEPVAVRDLLLVLVRDTPFSIVPDADVHGTFTGELKDVTLRQALDLILHPLGLDYSVQQTFIRVFRRRMETRILDVNHVIARRPPAGGAASEGGAAAGDPDIFDEIGAGVRTLLSASGRFNLDRRAALLQVRDFPDRLDRIRLYLEAVQARAHRQVQIEARVLDVELRDEFAAGVDWRLALAQAGRSLRVEPAPRAAGEVAIGARTGDFDALLGAFARQGRVTVLSSPRVIAMNNEPAVMRVGTEDVHFVATSGGDPATAPRAVTRGVTLTVTPQIGADGMINLRILPRVTGRVREAASRRGDVVSTLTVREAETLVRVHEQETVVIAGLLQETETGRAAGVPVLGRLPIVGGLFRRDDRRTSRTDLVILLTPTVLTPADVATRTAAR